MYDAIMQRKGVPIMNTDINHHAQAHNAVSHKSKAKAKARNQITSLYWKTNNGCLAFTSHLYVLNIYVTVATRSHVIRKMGMFMSFMGKGLPTTQLLSSLTGTLESQFMQKDVSDFEKFHMAILDIFDTVNAALPGKHYNVPLPEEVQECFGNWGKADESKKKEILIEFMKKKVNLSKLDDFTLITGLVTPPAAMAVKRGSESIPQLNLIKAIPDVIFVPACTVLALVSAKLSQKMILGQVGS